MSIEAATPTGFDIEGIRDQITRGGHIRMRSYAMLDSTEAALKEVLGAILGYYERDNLMDAVYTSLKELAINAVKANMKRVVFQSRGLDINNEADASLGHELFKRRLRAGELESFGIDSRRMGYSIAIEFILEEDCFVAEIRNNALLSDDENRRLRDKLKRSMTYEDIAQFYMDFADNTEGAGLGMTMITVMLKENQIDPHCFTIFTDADHTIARLEVPVTENYVPRRKRFEQLAE